MKCLLDTQALLWWLKDSPRLKSHARAIIEDGRNTIYVSAVSAWEMEIKRALGKLASPDNLEETLANERFLELPVHIRHTACLRQLPAIHRDPFDRLLIAQALSENLTVMTADPKFLDYKVVAVSLVSEAC